jgi:hypothetical protein
MMRRAVLGDEAQEDLLGVPIEQRRKVCVHVECDLREVLDTIIHVPFEATLDAGKIFFWEVLAPTSLLAVFGYPTHTSMPLINTLPLGLWVG